MGLFTKSLPDQARAYVKQQIKNETSSSPLDVEARTQTLEPEKPIIRATNEETLNEILTLIREQTRLLRISQDVLPGTTRPVDPAIQLGVRNATAQARRSGRRLALISGAVGANIPATLMKEINQFIIDTRVINTQIELLVLGSEEQNIDPMIEETWREGRDVEQERVETEADAREQLRDETGPVARPDSRAENDLPF